VFENRSNSSSKNADEKRFRLLDASEPEIQASSGETLEALPTERGQSSYHYDKSGEGNRMPNIENVGISGIDIRRQAGVC